MLHLKGGIVPLTMFQETQAPESRRERANGGAAKGSCFAREPEKARDAGKPHFVYLRGRFRRYMPSFRSSYLFFFSLQDVWSIAVVNTLKC